MRLSGYQKKANLAKKAAVSWSMNLINFLNLLLGSTAVLSTIKVLKTCEASKNMHLWMLLVDNIIIFL
jgi:hypothetical protein